MGNDSNDKLRVNALRATGGMDSKCPHQTAIVGAGDQRDRVGGRSNGSDHWFAGLAVLPVEIRQARACNDFGKRTRPQFPAGAKLPDERAKDGNKTVSRHGIGQDIVHRRVDCRGSLEGLSGLPLHEQPAIRENVEMLDVR